MIPKVEKIDAALKACVFEYFLCGECPYKHLESSQFPVRCLHALLTDIASIRTPARPIHIHEEYPEHDWARNFKGEIDLFAASYEFHNGPRCVRCHHSECEHCNPYWEIAPEEPCVVDYDACPTCGSKLDRWDKDPFCSKCGQAIDWSSN